MTSEVMARRPAIVEDGGMLIEVAPDIWRFDAPLRDRKDRSRVLESLLSRR